jgi:hypothetical protein
MDFRNKGGRFGAIIEQKGLEARKQKNTEMREKNII